MSDVVFEPRGRRRLLGIVVPSFLVAVTLGALGTGAVPVRGHGHNTYSRSAVGHHALVEILESLDIPVVSSQGRSGARASPHGVLLVLDPRTEDDTPFDSQRLEDMIRRAPVTLIALPKWNVRPHPNREDWASHWGHAHWDAVEVLRALDLPATQVLEEHALAIQGTWQTQNFGPAPVLSDLQVLIGDELDPLIRRGNGTLVGEIHRFDRRVVVLSDPDLVSTRGLSDPGNAVLTVRLIEHLRRGGPVVVDEVLHGYATTPSFWRTLFRPPILFLVLHGLLCVLLLVWAGWRRFGPPPAPRRVHPQGLRERIAQSADLLAMGPTNGVALRGYLQATQRAVEQEYLPTRRASSFQRAASLDRLGTARGTSESWSALSQDLSDAVADRPPSLLEAVHLAQRVHRWRQEMTHDAR